MIAALLHGQTPVEVESALCGNAVVNAIGRENIDSVYIGGQGYTGVPFGTVDISTISDAAVINPECDEYQNWIDAMDAVDRLSNEDRSPDLAAAIAIEDQARTAFVEYVQSHSKTRVVNQ